MDWLYDSIVSMSPRLMLPLSFDMRNEQICKTINTSRHSVSLHIIEDWNFESERRMAYPVNTWTLIFGWKWKLSRRTFIDVVSTLIELYWFNVGESTLFQRWNLVENESWADVCLSTLFQRWQNNVEITFK